jgi:3-oxoacyl-[acyl-carrier-protein] synthase-1
MPATPLAVLGVGLVSGVGLTAEESCAAIRCGINNFQETRFIGSNGDWLVGSAVELEEPWRGITRLAKMAARAIGECFAAATDAKPEQVPVLVVVAEPERPGRFEALPQVVLHDIEQELGFRLHPHSRVIEQGRVGGAVATLQARRMLQEGRHARIIVAGVDSFLTGPTLTAFDRADRLLRRDNSNGFIPGEAAAAVLLATWQEGLPTPLLLRGLGFAREPAPLGSGMPMRAEGLVNTLRAALGDAAIALKDCDVRIGDMNGEQYRFKEAALAITRLLRDRKPLFPLWHIAHCTGEIGAATLPAMLAVLFLGARNDYLPGPVFLGHLGNDDEKRAAFVAQAMTMQALALALEMAAEASYRTQRRSAA